MRLSYSVKIVLMLSMFLATTLMVVHVQPAKATGVYSTNIISYPSFEEPGAIYLFDTAAKGCPTPPRWCGDIYDDGTYGDTIAADNSLDVLGQYSAKIDIGSNSTAIKLQTQTTNSHVELINYLPANTMFSNITDRTNGLDIWFYVQPKYSGYSIIETRLRAGSGAEMDYIFVNPTLATQFGFGNSTTGSESGKPLKQFLLTLPATNQWFHFTRNLKQDWLAPLKLSDGTIVQNKFNSTDLINRFEVNANFYKNSTTGAVYAETLWTDEVTMFVDSPIPPPPPPPSNYYANFNFEDTYGNPVAGTVDWQLFNSTGSLAQYTQGSPTLTQEPYTLHVFYPSKTSGAPQQYLIHTQKIVLNSTNNIALEMFPLTLTTTGYVAFNNTISTFNLGVQTPSELSFSATGTGGQYRLIVTSLPKPTTLQRNNDPPESTNWSYDNALMTLTINTYALGNFSIFYQPAIALPNFGFRDISGTTVTNMITTKIFDLQGNQVNILPGKLIFSQAYMMKAYYRGYPLFETTITNTTQTSIQLQMVPIGTSGSQYVALNTTYNSFSLHENSASKIAFAITTSGPSEIVLDVPSKPLTIEKDGVSLSSWTYNATTGTVAFQAGTGGTFTILLVSEPPAPPYLLIVAGLAVAVAGLSIGIWWRMKRRPSLPKTQEVKPARQDQRPKTKRG